MGAAWGLRLRAGIRIQQCECALFCPAPAGLLQPSCGISLRIQPVSQFAQSAGSRPGTGGTAGGADGPPSPAADRQSLRALKTALDTGRENGKLATPSAFSSSLLPRCKGVARMKWTLLLLAVCVTGCCCQPSGRSAGRPVLRPHHGPAAADRSDSRAARCSVLSGPGSGQPGAVATDPADISWRSARADIRTAAAPMPYPSRRRGCRPSRFLRQRQLDQSPEPCGDGLVKPRRRHAWRRDHDSRGRLSELGERVQGSGARGQGSGEESKIADYKSQRAGHRVLKRWMLSRGCKV